MITLCIDNNVEYSAGIITNGILLDKNAALSLVENCKVAWAQITLDGTESIHNSRRIFNNGFNIIIKNIMECKEIIPIFIRVNVDQENKSNTIELLNYLSSLENFRETVRVYFAQVFGCNSCLSNSKFDELYIELIAYMKKIGFNLSIENICPEPAPFYCGAPTNSCFVIDPNGYLYTCQRQIGCDEYVIGNIFSGSVLNASYLNWLSFSGCDQCKVCTILPICHGGCPLNNINKNSFECTLKLSKCKEILKNYYSILSE